MGKVKQAALILAQKNPEFREALLTQMRSKSASALTEDEWANVHKKMAKIMVSAFRDGVTHDYWASTVSVPRDVGHGMYFQFGTQSFPNGEVNAYISVFTPMFSKGSRDEWVGLYMGLGDLLRNSKRLFSALGQVKFTIADKAIQLWVTLPLDKRTSESEKVLLRVTQHIAKRALSEIRAARSLQKTSAKTASARLLPALKREINKQLIREGFGGSGRWRKPEQGYAKALEVLSKFDIELDTVVSSHLFNRPQGFITVDVAFTNEEDPFSPESISNSILRLDWTDVGNGYEIIGYMS